MFCLSAGYNCENLDFCFFIPRFVYGEEIRIHFQSKERSVFAFSLSSADLMLKGKEQKEQSHNAL